MADRPQRRLIWMYALGDLAQRRTLAESAVDFPHLLQEVVGDQARVDLLLFIARDLIDAGVSSRRDVSNRLVGLLLDQPGVEEIIHHLLRFASTGARESWDGEAPFPGLFLELLFLERHTEDAPPPVAESGPPIDVPVVIIPGPYIGICGRQMAVDDRRRELRRTVVDIDVRTLPVRRR